MALAMFTLLAGCGRPQSGDADATDQPIVLRISADSPSVGNVCKGTVDVWAAKVEAESKGRLKFQIMCDGVLSKVGDTINRVNAGVADLGWDLPGFYGARFASLGISGVPGLYDDPEVAAGAFWNLYAAGKVGKELQGIKVIWFQFVNNTAFYLRRPPPSATDFTGMKIAMGNAMRASTVKAAGGVPVAISPPEYYQAIAKGTVDGVQSTIGAVSDQKIDEVTRYYLYGPFGGGKTIFVMNQSKYDSLPDDLKQVIDNNAGYNESRWSSAFLRDYEERYLREKMLTVKGNVRVDLTPQEVARWQPAFAQVAAEWARSVPGGEQMLADLRSEIAAEQARHAP
ncbi:MAG: TRAP transporter substrate-binding protein DctP [Paludibacter sp.]